MKKFVKKSQKLVATSNLREVAELLISAKKRIEDNLPVEDNLPEEYKQDHNVSEPFILSTDGKVMAKVNADLNDVGFYYVVGQNVKSLTHVGSPSEITDVVFEYLKDEEVDVLDSVLPSGDLIVYAGNLAHTTNGAENIHEMLVRLNINPEDVTKIVYLGLSVGELEPTVLNPSEYLVDKVESTNDVTSSTADTPTAPGYEEHPTENTSSICKFPKCSCISRCESFEE